MKISSVRCPSAIRRSLPHWRSGSFFAAALLAGFGAAYAANLWDGGGLDTNWTTPENWDDNATPSAGSALTFGGTTQLTNTNDFFPDTSFTGITFAPGAGAFTLGGNQVILAGNIVNDSAAAQTINFGLNLNNVARAIDTGTAGITLGAGFTNSAATYQEFTKNGSGALTLAGNWATNTPFAALTINAGTLNFAPAANITIGGNPGSNSTQNSLIINGGASGTLGAGSTFTAQGLVKVGNTNTNMDSDATFTVSGGTLNVINTGGTAQGRIGLGEPSTGAGISIFNVTGGVVSVPGLGTADGLFIGVRRSARATFTGGVSDIPRITIGWNTLAQASTTRELSIGGTAVLNVSHTMNIGTGAVGAGTIRLTTMTLGDGTPGSGAFSTVAFTGGDAVAGTAWNNVLNWNGGMLRVLGAGLNGGALTNFLGNTDTVNVQTGGAIIDTNSLATTVTQNFLDAGGGGLEKRGDGTLTLSGAGSSYTGPTVLTGGVLSAGLLANGGANSTIGASPNAAANLVFNGGSLQYTGATAATDRAFTIAAGKTAAIELTSSAATLTLAGAPGASTGALTKTGPGTLVLSGPSAFTGATTLSAGGLRVDGSLAAGSAVSVANGATLSGVGTIGGAVSTVSGAILSPATGSTAGTLTVGSLSLTPGTTLNYEFGGVNDQIVITNAGGLALGGGAFNLFAAGGATPLTANGIYTLLDYTTSFTGSVGNLSIANAQVGKFYSLANDNPTTSIQLTVADATVSEWSGAVSNLWAPPGNWVNGVTPNTPGAVANFGQIPSAPTTVAVNGAKTVGSIAFNNLNPYTITGSAAETITLSNGIASAGLAVNSGSHTIAAPIVLATNTVSTTAAGTTLRITGAISGARTFTATGAGTTILAGTNSFTTTAVNGGTLQIGDGGASGTLGSGDVTIAAGGTLAFNRTGAFSVANNLLGAGGTLANNGPGTLTLTGVNTVGAFSLNAGTTVIGNPTVIPAAVTLTFNGGTLDLNGTSPTVGTLSGASGVITDNSAVAGTTTLTANIAAATTFGGSINNGPARSLSLTKTGAGILTLSGNNTASGPLTITNGSIITAGTGGSVPVAGALILGDGTNEVNFVAGGSGAQFAPTTTVTFANGTRNAKLNLRGSNQTLAGLDSATTTTLSIVQNDEATAPGFTAAPGLATLTLDTATDHSFTGLIRNQAGGGFNLIKEGFGTQEIRNIAAAPMNFNALTINNGKFVINLAGTNNTLGAATAITVNANGTLGLDGTWTMNRVITGAGTLLKQGTGTVILSAINTHTGPTVVSNGTLTFATVGGAAVPGNVTVGNGAAAVFLAMGAVNQFSPSAVLNFNNSPLNAKFELRGFDQTVAGLTSDPDDVLSIVQAYEVGIAGTSVLTINSNTDHVFTGLIRNSSSGTTTLNLVKTGTGTQELRNTPAQGNNFSALLINQGRVTLNFSGATGTLGAASSVEIAAGASLGLDGDWSVTRPIFGSGDVVKLGVGGVTISNTTGHTGSTTIREGTLILSGGLSGTAKVDLQSGGTLAGTGNIAPATGGDVNLLPGGKFSPGVGIGTLTATLNGGGEFDLSLGVVGANTQALLFELDFPGLNDSVLLTGGALNVGMGQLGFDDFAFTPFFGFGEGSYTLFDTDMPLVGSLGPNVTGSFGELTGTIRFDPGTNDLVLTVVPEPGAAFSLLAGAGAMLGLRRRRRSA